MATPRQSRANARNAALTPVLWGMEEAAPPAPDAPPAPAFLAEQARIRELRVLLAQYEQAYRQQNAPLVSDTQYDLLSKELKALEDKHPELRDPNSPTQKIGSDRDERFPPVRHARPMMSIDNTYHLSNLQKTQKKGIEREVDSVKAFDERVRTALNGVPAVRYVVEPKVDGVSISVRYEHGRLVRAATRGDGQVGDDITANALTIRNLPHTIPSQADVLEVRGEVFMSKDDFQAQQAQLGFANARNAVAGTLKQLDPAVVAARPLQVVMYFIAETRGLPSGGSPGLGADHDVVAQVGGTRDIDFLTQADVLNELHRLGFMTPHRWWVCYDIDEACDRAAEMAASEESAPYEMDGAVIKVCDRRLWARLGTTSKFPLYAIAYKYNHEQARTRLLGITLQIGRTGVLTPVAELEPVSLLESTISRATLHNEPFVQKLRASPGVYVFIEKAGEVIPAVVGVDPSTLDPHARPYSIAEATGGKCPSCGTPLVVSDDGGTPIWRCPNPDCLAQRQARIIHFASRQAMDIEGIGDERVALFTKRLWNANRFDLFQQPEPLLHDFPDIYRLTREAIVERLRSYSEWVRDQTQHSARQDKVVFAAAMKSPDNYLAAIERSKHNPLWRLLFGLGIPNVGVVLAKALAEKFGSLDAVMSAQQGDFLEMRDVSVTVADGICGFFAEAANRAKIEALRAAGVRFDVPEAKRADNETAVADPNGFFFGKRVVLTGTLSACTREAASARLQAAGAIVVGTLGKTTDFLIVGDKPGSKIQKAAALGIPILSEPDFLAHLPSSPSPQ